MRFKFSGAARSKSAGICWTGGITDWTDCSEEGEGDLTPKAKSQKPEANSKNIPKMALHKQMHNFFLRWVH